MERRFKRDLAKENKPAIAMQKKLVENRRLSRPEPVPEPGPVPDLADFMNDWFFGSADAEWKTYDLTGGGGKLERKEEEGKRNSNSRLTQEWLEEAKRMVAMSPRRHESPSRLVGSPRFAAAKPSSDSPAALDRTDPLSRSARRHRAVEGFSGEILSKSARYNRNYSDTNFQIPKSSADPSPASAVHQWFSNFLNPRQQQQNQTQNPSSVEGLDRDASSTAWNRPPRQPVNRRSRFQNDAAAAAGPDLPRRSFREPENQVLSPPRNLIESAHRRKICSSTCSTERLARPDREAAAAGPRQGREEEEGAVGELNGFLRDQRARIGRISKGEISCNAKIILSGSNSNGTSSMVAAICYAWLLENINNKEEKGEGWSGVVVPVMNMKRRRMWKQKQAAWLLHHVGIDASALLFSDEMDLENLIIARQPSILVVGQDVLKTNGEVGSICTMLTDNYCEDAYDLLQTPYLKKLLLAGILLDTENLSAAAKFSTNRDAEAVQLLLVGSALSHRHVFYDQLTQDQRDNTFLEGMRYNYGKPSATGDDQNGLMLEDRVPVRKSVSNNHQEINRQTADTNPGNMKPVRAKAVPPRPAKKSQPPELAPKQAAEASRGKNKFFLAKWFGFGSK